MTTLIKTILGMGMLLATATASAAVGQNPYSDFSAGSYASSNGICLQGDDVACASHGDYIRFDQLPFGANGANQVGLTVAVAPAAAGQQVQIRLGGNTGTLLGTLTLASTGSASNYTFQSVSITKVTGTQSITFVFPGNVSVGPIDRIRFTAAPVTPPPPPPPTGNRDPYVGFSAGTYASSSGICLQGDDVACAASGDYIRFDQLDFGTNGSTQVEFGLAVAPSVAGQQIQVRLGGNTGTVLGTLTMASTGSASSYNLQSVNITKVTGVQSITFVFPGSVAAGPIDGIRFVAATTTPPPPPPPPVTVGASGVCPSDAINVLPGASIQAAVNAAAAGASFCLKAGVHRMQAIVPKNNQKFYGENGQSILNGSRLITSFTQESGRYVASGQTQQGQRLNPECIDGQPRCAYPEMFLIDDVPLIAVDSLAKVAAGKFFFNYDTDKIYFSENPAGRKVEASVTAQAFSGSATGVTVQGLIVEKYSTPIQFAAISGSGGSGWVIQNNTARLNYALGISVHSGRILRNYVHNNGEMGQGCTGLNVLVEGNEIAHNGWYSGLDPLWEGGGMKCAETTNLVVRGNYSHHNNAMGLWTDINNVGTLYENNRIEHNTTGGISHEISYSAVIRNNTFKGNGYEFFVWLWGGAIQIQNSQSVEVYGNYIEAHTGNGITLIQQNRGSGSQGPYVTVNNYVHDNTVVSSHPDSSVGSVADYNPAGLRAGNNRFNNNTYRMTVNDDHFWWVDKTYTFTNFRSAEGQELNGSISAP